MLPDVVNVNYRIVVIFVPVGCACEIVARWVPIDRIDIFANYVVLHQAVGPSVPDFQVPGVPPDRQIAPVWVESYLSVIKRVVFIL
jgi:hypothetical protein